MMSFRTFEKLQIAAHKENVHPKGWKELACENLVCALKLLASMQAGGYNVAYTIASQWRRPCRLANTRRLWLHGQGGRESTSDSLNRRNVPTECGSFVSKMVSFSHRRVLKTRTRARVDARDLCGGQ